MKKIKDNFYFYKKHIKYMVTLKLGSKGDDVKKLQQYLSLTVDGVFGVKTESAVKVFQKSHGLVADGIVGPNTWQYLTTNTVDDKCVDSSVTYSPLSVHITKSVGRPLKYIVIHYTAGGSSKPGVAASTKRVFETRQASADFCVDDANIIQFNPDIRNYFCWAVGGSKYANTNGGKLYGQAVNKNCISIEMCSTLKSGTSAAAANHYGWTVSDKVVENTIKLTKILMKKYNISADRVIRHYDVTGKLCPGIPGWNNALINDMKTGKSLGKNSTSEKWLEFKSKLS